MMDETWLIFIPFLYKKQRSVANYVYWLGFLYVISQQAFFIIKKRAYLDKPLIK
jgi:hypothetical protein